MKPLILLVSVAVFLPAFAQLEFGTPFSDGCVLQRDRPVPVWGKAEPNAHVTVAFDGQTVSATADATGAWRVTLAPMPASKEGRPLVVSTSQTSQTSQTSHLSDVLVGEVWFASGQSNMECPIWGPHSRYRDMKGGFVTTMTELPLVRYVKMPRNWSVKPVPLKAKWRTLTAANLAEEPFSAVAFYYARELYLALGIPIGIVDASYGGTNIDAWTPRCGYENCDPSLRATAEYPVKADWKAATDRKGPIHGAVQQPTVLWNGMVASFAPMAMRGFIWYQGENNSAVWYQGEDRKESSLYCAKMHALYNGWSRAFENPDLKLYFAELAPYNQSWFDICVQQEKFAAEEKNAGLAVTADVGNFDDIHPNDKEIVAKRLVVHALKRDYGFAIPEDCSPVFRKATFADGQVALEFDHVKNWYHYASHDWNRTLAFDVAGTNGVWQEAKLANCRSAKDANGNTYPTPYVDESRLVVKSAKVPNPVKVRYMARPRQAGTLYNEASLPLGAFEAQAK